MASSSSKRTDELKKLESLFVQKLTEKYKLTERDIKRAFCKFDKDNSGYLDVNELTTAIHQFLNGVSKEQVADLVHCYDIDGDGAISLVEFTKLLMSRASPNEADWISVDLLTAPNNSGLQKASAVRAPRPTSHARHHKEDESAEDEIVTDLGGPLTDDKISYAAIVFLQNLRAMLTKIVMDDRRNNKIPLSNRLTKTSTQLYESIAGNLILEEFAPYMRRAEPGCGVDYNPFCRVMQKYVYPGSPLPAEEVLQHVYLSCLSNPNDPDAGADPKKLLALMFEKPQTVVNKFGFTKEVKSSIQTGRPTIGKGPLRQPERGELRGKLEISDIPYRFVTKKCRTSLATPSYFDMDMMERSSTLPKYNLEREYVFGLNSNLYSGNTLYSIPAPGPPGGSLMLYTSAAVGIVHDSVSNTQCFFDGHTDDITCVSMHTASGLVATGQMGKRPFLCIWDYLFCNSRGEFCGNHNYQLFNDNGLLKKIGDGFFERGVCSACFSFDATYICAVGCDDNHNLGVWDIESGSLILSNPCHSGVPPQIKSLVWCPALQHSAYISKEAKGLCDVFCTAGERHLKLWAFNRNTVTNTRVAARDGPMIYNRAAIMGKVTADKAKTFLSVTFAEPPVDSSGIAKSDAFDLLVCGSNGMVYKFRQAVCILAVSVSSGAVSCGVLCGGQYIVGAALGQIKALDRHTLRELISYSVHPGDSAATGKPMTGMTDGGKRPTSARPASAGRLRPSSAASGAARPGLSRDGMQAAGGASSSNIPQVSRKARVAAPKGADGKPTREAWGGPSSGFVSEKCRTPLPPSEGVKASTNVVGIAVETDNEYDIRSILGVTGFGKVLRVSLIDGTTENAINFHYGPVWALATGIRNESRGSISLIATGGDDKWLTFFSLEDKRVVTRARCRFPIRCCHFNSTCTFIAVGLSGGGVSLFQIEIPSMKGIGIFARESISASKLTLSEAIYRKDCVEDISDIKFSPNDRMLAVGSHDGYIDIYSCSFALPTHVCSGSTEMRYLKRLRGHVSYITHLDWSADNRLLQSTCGAYEILYWDVSAGKQLLSTLDAVESDTVWNTFTCSLGFPVMGIWPPNSDGTDVNSVDVMFDKGLVLTGDDFGRVNLFNYPCVAKKAPSVSCGGHSSHVMNVRVIKSTPSETWVATVGGNDNSVMIWAVRRRK